MNHTNTLFLAIIDSSRSFCVWKRKGDRLVKTDLSPKSIAKEILRSLEKSPIKPLNLGAEPTLTKQAEEME